MSIMTNAENAMAAVDEAEREAHAVLDDAGYARDAVAILDDPEETERLSLASRISNVLADLVEAAHERDRWRSSYVRESNYFYDFRHHLLGVVPSIAILDPGVQLEDIEARVAVLTQHEETTTAILRDLDGAGVDREGGIVDMVQAVLDERAAAVPFAALLPLLRTENEHLKGCRERDCPRCDLLMGLSAYLTPEQTTEIGK